MSRFESLVRELLNSPDLVISQTSNKFLGTLFVQQGVMTREEYLEEFQETFPAWSHLLLDMTTFAVHPAQGAEPFEPPKSEPKPPRIVWGTPNSDVTPFHRLPDPVWPEGWSLPQIGQSVHFLSGKWLIVSAMDWYPEGDQDDPEPFVHVVLKQHVIGDRY